MTPNVQNRRFDLVLSSGSVDCLLCFQLFNSLSEPHFCFVCLVLAMSRRKDAHENASICHYCSQLLQLIVTAALVDWLVAVRRARIIIVIIITGNETIIETICRHRLFKLSA